MRELPGGESAYQEKLRLIALATLLRRWRQDVKLTQATIAEKMGTKQSVIARLESFDNDSFPSIATVALFAQACNKHLVLGVTEKDVSVGEFVNGDVEAIAL